MRVTISTAGPRNELAIYIEAETAAEQMVIDVIGRMRHQGASLYAETEAGVYGVPDRRDDGQTMVGYEGEPPQVTINLF